MFGTKLKITPELLAKLKLAAEAAGASSVEEYAAQVLEEAVDKALSAGPVAALNAKEVDDIAKKLKGLGYLE